MVRIDQANLSANHKSRIDRNPRRSCRLRLSKRDIDILASCAKFQLLSTSQLAQLHFSSVSRARKRLRLLWQSRLLDSHIPRIAMGEGSAENYYYLSSRGMRLLQESQSGEGNDCRNVIRFRARNGLQLDHLRSRNQFIIDLMKAIEKRPSVRLSLWGYGRENRFSVVLADPDRSGQLERIVVIPDAVVHFRISDQPVNLYIEIDRGTMSLTRMRRKLLAYTRFFDRNVDSGQDHATCTLGVISTTERRSQRLGGVLTSSLPSLRQEQVFFEDGPKAANEIMSQLVKLATRQSRD